MSCVLKETPDGVRVSLRAVADDRRGRHRDPLRRRRPPFRGRLHQRRHRRRGPGGSSAPPCSPVSESPRAAGRAHVRRAGGHRQAGGMDQPRRRGPVPEGLRAEEGGPPGHARSRRHRRAAGRPGTATRLLRFLTGLPKSYQAEVVLGVATTTLDAGGEVTGRWDMAAVTLDQARAAARPVHRAPSTRCRPMVSAVQVGGRRLHELARAGIEVERTPRPVTVTRFDLEGPLPPAEPADPARCSPRGRLLVGDLRPQPGRRPRHRPRWAAPTCATCAAPRSGPYTLADAVALDEVCRAARLAPTRRPSRHAGGHR